jgi:hypothetical protein
VRKAGQEFCSSLQHKLRANSVHLLKGFTTITTEDISCIGKPDLVKNNPRLCALLDYNAYSDDPYPLSCPIIDSDDPDPFKAAFRSPVIMRVSIVPAIAFASLMLMSVTDNCDDTFWP